MSEHTQPQPLLSPTSARTFHRPREEKIHLLLAAQQTGGVFTLLIDEIPSHSGPPLHIHDNEDETLYMLEGECVVQLDDRHFTLPAGSAVFLPRGLPHAFTNLDSQPARALVIHTPGGFEQFFAAVDPLLTVAEPDTEALLAIAARHGINTVGPPLADALNGPPPQLTGSPVVHSQHIPNISVTPGGTLRILLNGRQTNNRLGLIFGQFPPGDGAPLHRHNNEDECLFILDGEITIATPDTSQTATTASAVFLPRHSLHAFRNAAKTPLDALAIVAPAGLEHYFEEIHHLITTNTASQETFLALARKYNLQAS